MAGAVSTSMGAMKPLLGKLAVLMGDEYKTLTEEVRKQVPFLEKELSAMSDVLQRMELMDELDPLAENWRDHVREMSYDMEDCVDDIMRDLRGADANAGFIEKITWFFRAMWASRQIPNRIKELMVLALEANALRERYRIYDCIGSTSGILSVDPQVSVIHKEAGCLVGIDGPREELVSWLKDSRKKLKVVSIVGFGGMGKTTLAKQVYDEVGGQFSCKAFVPVSQNSDMASLLSGLQLELGMVRSSACGEQDIIDRLREHLTNKRYLVVVDDLWGQSAWDIISCVFPEDGNESRIIVTTRMDDVALWACGDDIECIYRLKPLKEQDSRSLFVNRIFGSEDGCPPQFKEVSTQILKKCGRLPLAIITIAGLLSSCQARSLNQWESIRNSLGTKFATNPTLEEMRSILNLSYKHLPLHLRACFLYLGMYPEDHDIRKADLVRQWVAEGFVSNLHGSDLEDAAKSYFNELINRSMIQSGSTKHGEVVSCRVHDMMLDLIISKCAEDDFISVASNRGDLARLHGCKYKICRLSLKSGAGGAASGTTDTSLSQVRSFAQFGESKYTPPLSQFKYLRVLVFEFPGYGDLVVDLTSIGQLFQLRYLKVSAYSGSIELPTEIHGLAQLETLKICGQLAQNIPSDIVMLPRLSHLMLPRNIGLPVGIRNMKSLRILDGFDLVRSLLEDIEGLGEMTGLRALTLKVDSCVLGLAKIDALFSSIRKLFNLKSLSLVGGPSKLHHYFVSVVYNFPLHIEEMDLLAWPFMRVPRSTFDLHCLRSLRLPLQKFSTDDARALGMLPSLVYLGLLVMYIPENGAAIICKGLFPVLDNLVLCSFDDDVTACMVFEAGAMPKLRVLDLLVWRKWKGATPVGIEHLLGLEKIELRVSGEITHARESAFRNAAQVHPSHPSVRIR